MPQSQIAGQGEAFAKVEKALVSDEYAGQGGSFVFDPVTGKRTRAGAQPVLPVVEMPLPQMPAQPQE